MFLFEHLLSILLGIYLGPGFLGYMVILCLPHWETAKLFSIVAAPFNVPTKNEPQSQFFYILTNTYYFLFLFYSSHPNGYEVVYRCVLIFISLKVTDVKHIFMTYWTFIYLF